MSTFVSKDSAELVLIEGGNCCGGHHNRRWSAGHTIGSWLGCIDDHNIVLRGGLSDKTNGLGMFASPGAEAAQRPNQADAYRRYGQRSGGAKGHHADLCRHSGFTRQDALQYGQARHDKCVLVPIPRNVED